MAATDDCQLPALPRTPPAIAPALDATTLSDGQTVLYESEAVDRDVQAVIMSDLAISVPDFR